MRGYQAEPGGAEPGDFSPGEWRRAPRVKGSPTRGTGPDGPGRSDSHQPTVKRVLRFTVLLREGPQDAGRETPHSLQYRVGRAESNSTLRPPPYRHKPSVCPLNPKTKEN